MFMLYFAALVAALVFSRIEVNEGRRYDKGEATKRVNRLNEARKVLNERQEVDCRRRRRHHSRICATVGLFSWFNLCSVSQ